MDYKKLMGYSKPKNKKKVVKEQPKPKKTIIDNLKKELNEWSYTAPGVKTKITESVESQVKNLWKHTILPALGEDLTFSDKKHAEKAVKTLKRLVSKLKVDDFWIGE